MYLIQQTTISIAKLLTYIFNMSFKADTFPSKRKLAKIISIFKKSENNDVSNYRPISLLPQVSKILEKYSLLSFLSNNNSISDSQYGFRVKSSTSYAIEDATNYITSSLDKDYFTMLYSLISGRLSAR